MQERRTDEEQAELVKGWWRQNGVGLIVAVVVGLGFGYGWRYWQSYRLGHRVQASQIYNQMMFATADKKDPSDQVKNQLELWSDQLKKKYADTPYAASSQLLLAKYLIDQKQYQSALDCYQWVLEHSKQDILKDFAHFNAARLSIELKQYKQAFSHLNAMSKQFEPLVEQTRADVYRQMKEPKKAVAALLQAKAAYAKQKMPAPWIDLSLAQYPVALEQ